MTPVPTNSTGGLGPDSSTNFRCTPATPWEAFLFFVTNYFAHCLTIKTLPAETPWEIGLSSILSLFFPVAGVLRALDSIMRHARFTSKDELQQALRAGALCMVIRNDNWLPKDGDKMPTYSISGWDVSKLKSKARGSATEDEDMEMTETLLAESPSESTQTPVQSQDKDEGILYAHPCNSNPRFEYLFPSINWRTANLLNCKVHGYYELPPGYEFHYVPADAIVNQIHSSGNARQLLAPGTMFGSAISSSYNFPKTFIAIAQTTGAALTLYKSRGDQITRYGFAAYGLTVVPYIIMSIINLAAQIATPDYSTLYMVESLEMDEARRQGGTFEGTVGALQAFPLVERSRYTLRQCGPTSADFKAELETSSAGRESRPSTFQDIDQTKIRFKPGKESPRIYYNTCSPFFRGNVSKLRTAYDMRVIITFVITTLISSFSIIIIGALTRFQYGTSTKAQRAWTMSWLVVGIAAIWISELTRAMLGGFRWSSFPGSSVPGISESDSYRLFILIGVVVFLSMVFGIFFAPAIGGLVVVGQMLREYGVCKRNL